MTTNEINPEAEALKEAGNQLVLNKNYVDALKKYKKAASIDPGRAAYYANMAFCYDKLGEYKNFETASRQCIHADPSFVRGYERLGHALEKLWQFDKAIAVVDKGLVLDTNNKALKKLRAKIKARMGLRRAMATHYLYADGPDQVPFFGGLPDNQTESKILADSIYGRLERNVLPPQSRKFATKLQSGKQLNYPEDILPLVKAIFIGDLRIEWILSKELARVYEGDSDTVFLMYVYLIDQKDSVPTMIIHYILNAIDRNILGSQVCTSDPSIPLDLKQKLLLAVLQRFFREKAALLVGTDGNTAVLESIIDEECEESFMKYKMYQDFADMKMIVADVCVNVGNPRQYTIAAVRLGVALEAAKDYTTAAKVYMAVAEGKSHPGSTTVIPETRAYNYAGLAFKRAQDYVQAEEQYVRAQRLMGTNWTWRNDTEAALQNMMIFYENVHWGVLGKQLVGEEYIKIQHACLLLVGLLSITGYRCSECLLFQDEHKLSFYLKKDYKRPRKAMRALVAAFSAPNIEEYRKVLFQCGPKSQSISIHYSEDMEIFFREAFLYQRTVAKEMAREELFTHTNVNSERYNKLHVTCGGCKKPISENNMKSCPCKTVFYCSKECQLADWKIHKRICPHRKSK